VRPALADWACSPLYGAVVTAAFGQRRKTLRNALKRYLSAAQIASLGIDPGLRAETLTPMQFGALAQAATAVLH
jgi:16S rRNA (adenine1518-N6/adenine1519-N6)-dimethyltransferase